MDITDSPTPKQFLKNKRPEQFSSSEEVIINQLDRVHLEYYLSGLNTKSKELEFETFAKELCQKVICPNLLEQTGPVAGGDGKTDTQTSPVSEQNKLLWYVGVNSNANSDRWAFAMSTQKSWKPKCKSDVKKIVETQRDFAKVFCITNQLAKADQRSKLEDELSKQYGIQVCIRDLSWILDELYKNKLEHIAINTLQIPTSFERQIKLSPDDYSKQQRLEKLNSKVSKDIDPSKMTYEQVDIFLEIAELSKQLEKPVLESQGLYERAIKVAERFGTTNQIFNAFYSYARASYYWHEDFISFKKNLRSAYEVISESSNANLWTDFVTLLTIQMGHQYRDNEQNSSDFDDIVANTITQLNEIIKDKSRPSNALQAEIVLAQLQLFQSYGDNEKMEAIFKRIHNVCQQGEHLIGFPFERIYGYIDELDDIFHEYPNYQQLQDYLTEQSIKRNGDLKTSKIALERGIKQAEKGNYYRAIQLVGKTLIGLNKEEALDEMTIANMVLAEVYTKVDLYWAARGSLLNAASLLTNYYHKHNTILPMAIKAYFSLAWNELSLGRIAQSLTWLKTALWSSQVIKDNFIDEDKIVNFDGCLANLLLNCNLQEVQEFEYLINSVDEVGLFYTKITLLYSLGYQDQARELLECGNNEDLLKLMFEIRDYDTGHPTVKTLPTLPQYNTYSAKILGCKVILSFPNKTPFIELAESIITSLECFLATALIDSIIAKLPIVHIDISSFEDPVNLISHEYILNDKGSVFEIFCHPFFWEDLNQSNKPIIDEWLMSFIADFIDKGFLIKDANAILEKLIIEDKIFARSMMFETCLGAIYNILGRNSHSDLLETLTQGAYYPLLRKVPWDIDSPKENLINTEIIKIGDHEDMPVFDMEKHTHEDITMTTLIRSDLWDATKWEATGYMSYPNKLPYMFLLFRDKEQGLNIFRDLVQQLTHEDESERLRISVLRGIDRNNPAYYRIVLSENIQMGGKAKLFIMPARIKTMEAENPLSWTQFEDEYNEYGSFLLAPAFMNKGMPYPDVELSLAIRKKQLIIQDAWEIGINDIERVAIYPDDNIIVPDDVVNPPCLKLLESLRR